MRTFGSSSCGEFALERHPLYLIFHRNARPWSEGQVCRVAFYSMCTVQYSFAVKNLPGLLA